MRKSSFISVLVALLVVAAVVVWHFVPRQLPYSECSDIYKHYAAEKGIEATYIKDYKVNDTVFVDVTLLEATDSVGWNKLVEELNLVTPDSASQCDLDKGMDLIFLKQVKKDNYSQKAITPSGNVDVLATSYLKKKVTVFHTKNRNEKYSVFHYNYDISTNQ
ncbi:MAG: hypothetical protein IKQ20_02020 [Bacteroidales bacterium]|nr:hypothetical protein [Bacteroidales bacterium]